jgi:outer membrane protein assembly factor BamE (lipoprotein component of BamABCDE complex)
MKKFLFTTLIFTFLTNCGFKKQIDHHGVHLLKKKSDLIIISESNKNDIIKLLGPPSVKSTFNNDLYFYIERKITTDKVIKLGKRKYLENNVLVLEIDNRGIVFKKEFYDLNKMKKIKIVSNKTTVDYQKQSFIYEFLSSMRQKINDPLGKRSRD